MSLTDNKQLRLESLSTKGGLIAAMAVDQRKSLRKMIGAAMAVPAESIPDPMLAEFKSAVASVLTPHVSAVLTDPEYGMDAVTLRAPGCGLIMTYEADGFENPRPNRMLALLPHISVRRIREYGAQGVKILLSWAPDDDQSANDEKRTLIERIGNECAALDMPFFLEPVVYDPAGLDVKSLEFAKRKPELVVRTMEEFSRPEYRVDVLKVEFPVSASVVGGAWSKAEAFEWFRAADSASRLPYIYLSAGVGIDEFTGSLRLAAEAGARFSGVLCGRATWQEGVATYARSGKAALEKWLSEVAVQNLHTIDECLKAATPWRQRSEKASA